MIGVDLGAFMSWSGPREKSRETVLGSVLEPSSTREKAQGRWRMSGRLRWWCWSGESPELFLDHGGGFGASAGPNAKDARPQPPPKETFAPRWLFRSPMIALPSVLPSLLLGGLAATVSNSHRGPGSAHSWEQWLSAGLACPYCMLMPE